MNNNPADVNTRPPSSSTWTMEAKIGLALFLGALLFYAIKAPTFSVPGRWAGIVASFSGLDPFRPLIRPLWSGIIYLLSALPIPSIGYAVNLLSAVLGAGACWLVYEITRQIPYCRTFKRKGYQEQERFPRLVAGIFAALFAAVSLPMIMVSTRGDFAVLDIFLLLLAFYPFVLFMKQPRYPLLHLSCLVFGLALVEYPTMAFVLPAFLVGWVLLLWKKKRTGKSAIFLALVLLASGLLVLTLYVLAFAGSSAAEIRGMTAGTDILREFLRLYKAEITQSVPRVGWLLIISMNLIPFAFVMLRELEEPTDRYSAFGVYAFRIVLFMLAVLTLFSLPGSPARVLGPRVFLLAPSIIVAIWFGYLVGFYAGLFSRNKKPVLRNLFIGVWAVVLLAAGVRHAGETRVRHLAPVAAFADQVIHHLDGRNYIVTDGALDSSLLLAARKANRPVNLINVNAGASAEYGRYYATMFADADLQNLATLGSRTLLRGWLHRDQNAMAAMALLANPDVVSGPDRIVVPSGFFYTLVPDEAPPDAAELLDRIDARWTGWIMPDTSAMEVGDAGWFQSQFVIRWLSRQANDLGVYLDEKGQPDLAAEAYRRALAFWADNISATLNLREQARQQGSEEEEIITEQLKAQVERNPSSFNIHFLNQYSGAVRNPMAMLEQASALGRAGRMQQALSRLDQISDMLDEGDIGAQLAMAQLYLRGNNPEESEKLFKQILEQDPQNLDARFGLYQIAGMRRDFEAAGALLDIMDDLGADPKRMQLERANWNLSAGRIDEARRQFVEITREPGAPIEAWFAMAQIAHQQKDVDMLEAAMASLERDRNYAPGQYLLGERALTQKRTDEAQQHFRRVVALEPANENALIRLIQIDFSNRDAANLRLHTGALLALKPDHPFGNFMSAYVHIEAGMVERAEEALRRSLSQVDDGAARNELAWVLSELGQNEEALTHALRAVEMVPGNPNFWDTRATAHQNLGQKDEAVAAIEKALEITRRQNPVILVHAVRLYRDAGLADQAGEIMDLLLAMTDRLDENLKKEVAELAKDVKR